MSNLCIAKVKLPVGKGRCPACGAKEDQPCYLALNRYRQARMLIDAQAKDDGLWFAARTAPEAYLQQELRRLTAAIEGVKPDDAARAAIKAAEPEKVTG